MKIIFLDIDGILTSQQGERVFQRHYLESRYKVFPQQAILNLYDIVYSTGAKIVLSSSWRYDEERSRSVSKQLAPYGLQLFGMTTMEGDYSGEDRTFWRGCEIRQWLQEHPEVDNYVILDDDNDMLLEQQSHFVQGSWVTGLTKDMVHMAISILNS